jgi:hypothetical protein
MRVQQPEHNLHTRTLQQLHTHTAFMRDRDIQTNTNTNTHKRAYLVIEALVGRGDDALELHGSLNQVPKLLLKKSRPPQTRTMSMHPTYMHCVASIVDCALSTVLCRKSDALRIQCISEYIMSM